MAEQYVEVEGVNYYTLLEQPASNRNQDSSSSPSPCILLIHALMSNLHMYDSTVKTLHAAGYSTLRFDHIGHNKTPTPQQQEQLPSAEPLSGKPRYTMDDITRHMHALVQARVPKQQQQQPQLAGIIGCSIGGVLALRYAMLYPGTTSHIISIAAPGVTTPEPAKKLWKDRIELFRRDVAAGTDELCRRTVERWLPGTEERDEVVRKEALGHVRTCSLGGYERLAEAITTYDFDGDVERLLNDEKGNEGCKVLVVAGSEDGAADPEGLRKLAKRIRGAEFVCMQGAGHLPPMHRVEEFDRLMMGFLGKAR